MTVTCDIEWCDRPKVYATKGWCHTHYERWRRTGDVNTIGTSDPLLVRLMAYCEVEGDCWLYTGRLDNGYGRIRDGKGGRAMTHRAMYEELVGAIPCGLELDHLCKVRNCMNPDHLEPVTPEENWLRSSNSSALNAKKKKCHRGHPLSGQNLYRNPNNGRRTCIKCWQLSTGRNWRDAVS